MRMARKIIIDQKPRPPISLSVTAQGKRKDFQIEQDEQDRNQVVTHVELHARVLERLESAFVWG